MSCTSQLLNLTQHIENGYQNHMITGVHLLTCLQHMTQLTIGSCYRKPTNTTRDSALCRVIQNMLSSRRFYVVLNSEHSRWRKQKNGLPHGSVLSPVLFNIYIYIYIYIINDQTIYHGTRRFIYVDDLCVTAQYPSFTEIEETIEDAMG